VQGRFKNVFPYRKKRRVAGHTNSNNELKKIILFFFPKNNSKARVARWGYTEETKCLFGETHTGLHNNKTT
jgi:hypothetical protein